MMKLLLTAANKITPNLLHWEPTMMKLLTAPESAPAAVCVLKCKYSTTCVPSIEPTTSYVANKVHLVKDRYATFKGGEEVFKYTWNTESGLSLTAITFGAIVTNINVPDKNGDVADIVLGFDDLEAYATRNVAYFGAAIGRCANRIANGSFKIDGIQFQVPKNWGEYHLHGGNVGFDKVNWRSSVIGTKVIFSYLSVDKEEGYPGDLLVNLTYDVTNDGNFNMEFFATASEKTVVNLANHSYFNLAGHNSSGAAELYEHHVTINADLMTETDKLLIPTGVLKPVGSTPYDLRVSRRLGDVLKLLPNLYDDNYCINTIGDKEMTFAARVLHPKSGRYLEVRTDQPGVQFYCGGGLPEAKSPALLGKGGAGYRRHGAFCLETQKYPDAINHPNFPSPILQPGDTYRHRVTYKFGSEQAPGKK